MSQAKKRAPVLPKIIVGEQDYEKLTSLANAATGATTDVGEQLLNELERAYVLPQNKLSDDVVRMGSYVSFITSDGLDRSFQLVYPKDSDVELGKISVMTPIGAALIGLSGGQTIPWRTRDNRELSLTVRVVSQDYQP